MKKQFQILTCLAVLATSTVLSPAANLQWDYDSVTAGAQDGAGTWDILNANWTNGTANVVWNNSLTVTNTAVFGNGNGAANSGIFTVSLAGDMNVGGLTFNNAGTGNSYLINNPNANLIFLCSGTTSDSLTVASGVSAEINARLATSGSGTANIRSTGGGTLKLSGGSAAATSSIYFLRTGGGNTLNLTGNLVCSNNLMASGGILNLSGTNLVLGTLITGDSSSFGGNATNVINVTGGLTTASGMYMGKKNTTNAVTISGGSLVVSGQTYMSSDFNGSSTQTNIVSTITVTNTGLFDTGTGTTTFLLGNGTNTLATVNLDGGTLATARPFTTGNIGTHTSIFNFNGGTLKAKANQENLIIGSASPFTTISGVYVRNGGALFETTSGNLGIMHDILHSATAGDNATDGGLIVSGVGGLTLGGNNTYTGNSVAKSGALCVANVNSVPGYLSGSLILSNGAAFGVRLGSDSSIGQTDFDTIIASTTIFNGANKNVAISVSGSGGVPVDASTIGDISGSRSLVKVGAGTLQLGGTYNYSGPTVVSGGTLQLVNGAIAPPQSGYQINSLGILQIGDGTTVGSGDLGVNAVTNIGGKLVFARPDTTLVVTNQIFATSGGVYVTTAGGGVTFSNSGSAWVDTFPQAGTMIFDLGASGSVTASGNLSSSAFGGVSQMDWVSGNGNFAGVAVANAAGGTSTLNVKGGNLYFNASYRAYIGIKGTAYANVTGGTLTFGGTKDLSLGGDREFSATNASGILTISGGQFLITNATSKLIIGQNTAPNTGANGTINLYGGTLLSAGTITGGNGISTANFSGGTLKAGAANANWLTNVTTAAISTNGLIVDDGGFVVAINQVLARDGALAGADGGLTKNGNGTLYLNSVNTYNGPTVATGGALGGSGTIASNLTINTSATLAPGNNGVGTFTVNGNLAFNGNLLMNVNTTNGAQTNSYCVVGGTLSRSGAGTVTVVNLGPTLVVGQKFTLFNKPVPSGAAMTVSGGGTGVTWLNNLAADGSISVASVGPAPKPVINNFSLSGTTLNLTATNGSAGATWTLLQSTNVSVPISQWITNRTGIYDVSGNLSTNILNMATNTQAFFILKQ